MLKISRVVILFAVPRPAGYNCGREYCFRILNDTEFDPWITLLSKLSKVAATQHANRTRLEMYRASPPDPAPASSSPCPAAAAMACLWRRQQPHARRTHC